MVEVISAANQILKERKTLRKIYCYSANGRPVSRFIGIIKILTVSPEYYIRVNE
jgi:hypothetical protein